MSEFNKEAALAFMESSTHIKEIRRASEIIEAVRQALFDERPEGWIPCSHALEDAFDLLAHAGAALVPSAIVPYAKEEDNE